MLEEPARPKSWSSGSSCPSSGERFPSPTELRGAAGAHRSSSTQRPAQPVPTKQKSTNTHAELVTPRLKMLPFPPSDYFPPMFRHKSVTFVEILSGTLSCPLVDHQNSLEQNLPCTNIHKHWRHLKSKYWSNIVQGDGLPRKENHVTIPKETLQWEVWRWFRMRHFLLIHNLNAKLCAQSYQNN